MEVRVLYLFFMLGCAQLQAAAMQKPESLSLTIASKAKPFSLKKHSLWAHAGQVEKKKVTFTEPLISKVWGCDYSEKSFDDDSQLKDKKVRGFLGGELRKSLYNARADGHNFVVTVAQKQGSINHSRYFECLRQRIEEADFVESHGFSVPKTYQHALETMLEDCLVLEDELSPKFPEEFDELKKDGNISKTVFNPELVSTLGKGYLQYVGLDKELVRDDAKRLQERKRRIAFLNEKIDDVD